MNAIIKDFANKFRETPAVALGKDMLPEEIDSLRSLLDKFFTEEKKEPEHTQAPALSGPLAAGIVLQAPSGKVLLLMRAPTEKNYGGHWGLPGGKAEEGESPEEAARRETLEETGFAVVSDLTEFSRTKTPNGFTFVTFLAKCNEEFSPVLGDGEHTDHYWATPGVWTHFSAIRKMHPNVEKTMSELSSKSYASDSIAMDKDTVRSFDDVGRMNVELAHISKACVNPYYGKEIPNCEELGLDPEKIYYMLRDPEELKKGASTFNNIQVLIRHIPVSADDPQKDDIVGTTGSNAVFNDPYLDNDLSIWSEDGIKVIENGLQKELSCGYGYDPVMEPGTYEGVRYDGRMTNIKGNHVALVNKGRAGPDVVVSDEALKPKENEMAKTKPLTRASVMVKAALSAYIMPKIALDSQLKLSTSLSTGLKDIDTTKLKSKATKSAIIKMAKDAAEPMMTPEAKADGGIGPDHVMMRLLDMVDGQASAEPAEVDQTSEAQEADGEQPGGDDWRKPVMDKLCGAGMSEDDAKAVCDMFPASIAKKEPKEGDANDEDDLSEDEDTPEAKEKEEAMAKKKAEDDKKAMDSAINAAREGAKADTMKLLGDIRAAEKAVEPLIGSVTIAADSADTIYIHALNHFGVKTDGVHSSALPAMVDMLTKTRAEKKTPALVQDGALSADARAEFDKGLGVETRHVRQLGV